MKLHKKESLPMDYKEALAYIGGVAFFGSKPGLTRIRELLEKLDL